MIVKGDLAEKAAALFEGQRVLVEGRLTAHHWRNADATHHHHVQLIADKIEDDG